MSKLPRSTSNVVLVIPYLRYKDGVRCRPQYVRDLDIITLSWLQTLRDTTGVEFEDRP